jgi:4'-phosphopantetheinyl transferase
MNLPTLPSPLLAGSDIHIWCASLKFSSDELIYFATLLSTDEKVRAERFYFERDRHHFIAGRGLLRCILGSYLEKEPAQIEFDYGKYGKPSLKSKRYQKNLEFNLSHSKDLVIYAVGWNRVIGIDIEYHHPLSDMNNFAEQYFSPRESAYINLLSAEQKESAFFKLWTCKEAFLKANGSGLRMPLNEVEISLENEKGVILSSIAGNKIKAMKWRLETFSPLPGYQAACIVNGNDGQVIFQQLPLHHCPVGGT